VFGFTLIELVISAALAAMILVGAYMCLSSAISSQKLIEPRVEVFQNARVAMAIMSADLRSACPLAKEFMFLGMPRMIGDIEADNLDFATHNFTPQHPHEGDYCQTSFYVGQEPLTGQLSLWRRRNPTIGLDPLSGGSEEEIARGVRGLKFDYYDGYDWYDTWGEAQGRGKQRNSLKVQPNLSGMPEAVRITLWLDPNPQLRSTNTVSLTQEAAALEPPLAFQTVARLNLATVNSRDTSGSTPTAGDANDANGPGNGGMNQ